MAKIFAKMIIKLLYHLNNLVFPSLIEDLLFTNYKFYIISAIIKSLQISKFYRKYI